MVPHKTYCVSHRVECACEGILHGLLDGVPNVLHLEEARHVGQDGHEEHGEKVVGEDLEGRRNLQSMTTLNITIHAVWFIRDGL